MGEKKDTRPKRLDAYIRQSSTRDKAGLSPDNQKDKIRDWARYKGHEIIGWPEELDVSGRKSSRPKLDEVMRRIREGETDGVVVWKASRFGRNLLNSLMLIKEIDECGGMFASATEDFDTSTRQGRLVMGIMLLLAEDESEGIKENWLEYRTRAAKRGAHMGPTPFGYLKRDQRGPDGKRLRGPDGNLLPESDGRLYPDPANERFVKGIFERRASGQSWVAIKKWLDAEGARTQYGQPFNRNQPKRIVSNEVYLGTLIDGVSGERIEKTHPALVDYATWQAAQGRPSMSPRPRREPETLLGGLVRCAGCRYTMNPKHRRGDGRTAAAWRYYCRRQHDYHDCPDPALILAKETGRKYLDKDAAKKAVAMVEAGAKRSDVAREFGVAVRTLDIWRNRASKGELDGEAYRGLDDYVVERVFERLPEIEAQAYGLDSEVEELDTKAKAARAELNAFAKDRELEKSLGREAYLERGKDLREIAEDAEHQYNEALRRNAGQKAHPPRRLRDDWEDMTLAEKREYLATLIRYVFVKPPVARSSQEPVSPGRVHVVWFDQVEVDIPRRGRRNFAPTRFVFPDNPNSPDNLREAVA